MAEAHEKHGHHKPGQDQAEKAAFTLGQDVYANFGEGKVFAKLGDLGHEVAGADGAEIKYKVFNYKTGAFEDLGYREPSGPDADTGRTFWKVA